MTTANEARTSLYQEFSDNWTLSPYTFPNEAFDEPETEWVRLSVLNGAGGQHTLNKPGARIYRRLGIVFAEIFVPTDAGIALADSLGQAVLTIFEGKRIGEVSLNDGVLLEVGPQGRWFKMNATIALDYDETK